MNLTLKQERINRGWTLEFVAQQIGISLSAIQKIECGIRKPSYDVLVKLENLFHMGHRDLFAEIPTNTKEPDGNQAK